MKIAWSPDGASLLVLEKARTRVCSAEPPHDVRFEAAPSLDGIWDGDDVRLVIADFAASRRIERRRDGELVETITMSRHFHAASLGGDRLAVQHTHVTVHDANDGRELWNEWNLRLNPVNALQMSPDGRRLALGHAQQTGRGWVVVEPDTNRVIDRSFARKYVERDPYAFAFDRTAKRLVREDADAIRLGRGEVYPAERAERARAVALDDKGVIAAYAYASRVRFDYLDAAVAGKPPITITSTLSLPVERAFEAIAISPDRRSFAGLCADGSIEVLPIP